MARYLLVSHSPLNTTGYGRVVRWLADTLASGGHAIAGCLGSGRQPTAGELPYPVRPWPDLSPAAIADAVRQLRPDVLLTVGDPWMFAAVPPPARTPLADLGRLLPGRRRAGGPRGCWRGTGG